MEKTFAHTTLTLSTIPFRYDLSSSNRENLACRKILNGTTIYSLVTKDNFYGKPTLEKYSLAFKQLLESSAIACVRDEIKPNDFS